MPGPRLRLHLLLWCRAPKWLRGLLSRAVLPWWRAPRQQWYCSTCCYCRRKLRQRQGRLRLQRSECYVSWSSRGCSSYVKRREVGLGRTTRQADGSSGRSTTFSLRPPRSERAPPTYHCCMRTNSSRIPNVRNVGRNIPARRVATTRQACRFGRTRRGRGLLPRPGRRRCLVGRSTRRCSRT